MLPPVFARHASIKALWCIRNEYRKVNKRIHRWKKEIVFQLNIAPMAAPVKYVDPLHPQGSRTNWQTLGQLKLRAGANPDGTIKTWLLHALRGFSLPGNLVNRLQASMEEATARVLSPDSIEERFEYLEIVVLVPVNQASKGHIWGFFRVEKASVDSRNEPSNGHCVEYYLYLDKKKGK